MSEADVRAEIIDPIISRLGYRFGTAHYVERERRLIYPYTFIGHKSRRDLPVGAADYICGVDGRRGSFSVEAKRGSVDITGQDVEQAHSYAAHPEVRADFFVISNGLEVRVYETMRRLQDEHLLCIDNASLDARFHELAALLAPDSLVTNCARTYDLGRPLSPGYGSTLNFGMGWLRTTRSVAWLDAPEDDPIHALVEQTGLLARMRHDIDEIRQYRQPVEQGILRRDDTGRMVADVEFGSAHEKLEHNLAAMNLRRISFTSDAPEIPELGHVLFETHRIGKVPEGTEFYSGIHGELEQTGIAVDFGLHYRVLGQMSQELFSGDFSGTSVMTTGLMPPLVLMHEGDFQIRLSTIRAPC